MDAQLKYRLTGAVILVLLAVLFVPELLTGPKPARPGAGPEPAPTTADGAPLRSYDIDLSDAAPAAPLDEAAEAASPTTASPAMPGEATTPMPPSGDTRRAAPSAATPAPPAVVAETGARATSPAASRPAPSVQSSAPAGAAPQPAATVAAAATPSRGFAVQVGSFASRKSADRLAGELRGRRFDAFVSPVRSAGRQMFRVRVGPVEDRAAALALAARLKASGQSATVVPLP